MEDPPDKGTRSSETALVPVLDSGKSQEMKGCEWQGHRVETGWPEGVPRNMCAQKYACPGIHI